MKLIILFLMCISYPAMATDICSIFVKNTNSFSASCSTITATGLLKEDQGIAKVLKNLIDRNYKINNISSTDEHIVYTLFKN